MIIINCYNISIDKKERAKNMKSLKDLYDLYLNDALYKYEDFNNNIKKIKIHYKKDFFEIKLINFDDKFVDFYVNVDNLNKLIVTTDIYNNIMQSILENNKYYSGRGYVANLSIYSFIECFKYSDLKTAFKNIEAFK